MIEALDRQMVGRFCECALAHPELPIHTSPLSQHMDSHDAMSWAMDGVLTHVMYVKDGRIYVGWFDSAGFKWFFDAWGTSPIAPD